MGLLPAPSAVCPWLTFYELRLPWWRIIATVTMIQNVHDVLRINLPVLWTKRQDPWVNTLLHTLQHGRLDRYCPHMPE